MPDLVQSLQGRDLGHLRIIAELWGFDLEAPDARSGLEVLVPALLSRELLVEVIDGLPEMARRALEELVQQEGRLSWAGFTRRYGAIREIGPARRDREKPYLSANASSTEALWYRALLGRAFFDTPSGPEEFAYIPDDIVEILPPVEPPERQPLGRPASPLERTLLIPADDRILDDACTLLAGIRLGLSTEFLAANFTCGFDTPYPLTPAQLHALLHAAGLIDSRGVLLSEPVRAFLEASRGEALLCLVRAWLRSQEFDELRLLPGLVAEGEWQNDALLARQAILDFLSTIPGSQSTKGEESERPFWSLPAFIAGIRQAYPDFQRPAGDYDSWYLRDAQSGKTLRGIEHWEEVDGALVRFIIAGPMHWLGIIDLAAPQAPEQDKPVPVTGFRFSAWAADLLDQLVPQGLATEDKPLLARSDGCIFVPAGAPRAVRYQVARFGAWEGVVEGEHRYCLTPASLELAREQGLRVDHLLGLLRRYARNVPPSLVQALQRWEARGTEMRIERATVLRVKEAEQLQTLRNSRAARFLGDPLGPTTVIVKPGALEKVAAILAELGFLSEVKLRE